jgi:hypothetical protein
MRPNRSVLRMETAVVNNKARASSLILISMRKGISDDGGGKPLKN